MDKEKSMKAFAVIAAVVIGVGWLASLGKHHDSNTSSAASSSAGSAHITMLRGASSDNACEENDGDARIYVTITLKNTGDAAGTVNPWATFDYSDGGNSTESYLTNYGHEFTIPAHTVLDATFYHTFNPQQHSMIRCAGYVDQSDSSGYYLPTS